jgi:putative hydrolase of the HAD superfamily
MSVTAVVSDFGGVLTVPLMEAFARAEGDALSGGDAAAEGRTAPPTGDDAPALLLQHLPAAMARSGERDGEHPLYALERGEISERAFLSRLERALGEELGRPLSLDGFAERLMGALRPNEALFDHYRALKARGVRFALCTNNVREWEARWRALLPIDEVFEVVVDSAFVGTRKPEPEIYAITLERLGLPAEACVFVDDLEVNVAAARAAGMHGIHFRSTEQAIAELDELLGAGG